ncbi:PREDICTED: LOW QUALITY PROTEIN: thrombopoietin receptor, partial [Buceros rhinoceros silvestris]|uniref:LOW QUALITY PROTEIN: thrombopoietin receptor n=1 Tax=Buceros rhinoceros silvestris TaxID=175836 RepID=UPI0005284E80
MAACLRWGWLLSLLPTTLLSLHSPLSAPELVTSQDAALLAGVPEDILCFSRSFEDLTCFWDEKEAVSGMCHFYYWYNSQDVRLFIQLHLRVLDAATNQTKYRRELSVEAVGLIAPPVNITARWAGAAGQLCGLVQANTWVVLQDLQPGVRYHIQVRSKPDGTSMDGVWGPWSQAVAAETPRSSGDIGLCCSTPDLRHVHCEWSWDPAEPHSFHQLFYRPPPSGDGHREEAWKQCQESTVGAQGTHTCTFQPRAGSTISVLVNITRPHAPPTLSYFKEPFWLHQAVLTEAPELVEATVSQGRLSLQWLPPLEALAEQLDYQVRYAVENSHDWKVLQVPQAARKEVLDLRPGTRYHAQVRAQPSGPWYRGSWSAWSEPVVVDAIDDAGWIIPSVTVVPLLFTGVLLGLRCTFPSLYSNVKQKLW